jgi:Cellulase (glycosyl hydrolase family 5)
MMAADTDPPIERGRDELAPRESEMPRAARFRRVLLILAILLLALAVPTGAWPTPADGGTADENALVRRAGIGLAHFTDWLQANNAKGYIGEVGWPESTESDRWNALADRWYRDADSADLWVTAWATGEWWGTYPLAVYQDRTLQAGVDTPGSQARVLEQHPTTPGRLRGVNVAGAEFTAPSVAPTSPFSNANPGVYQRDYHYDGQATFTYLAGRGVRLVRIPFRWERVAPRLGGPLDRAEVGRLKAAVGRARHAGLLVVLDMHNYGGYYLSDGRSGVRRALGSAQVPIAVFAETWRRLSVHFRSNPAVVGYGLMNEPVDMPSVGTASAAVVWERASQAVVTAIRANRDRKWVMVSSYPWGGVWQFGSSHPRAWVRDPAKRVRYEAHQYFDHDNSGTYRNGYEGESSLVAAAEE